MAETKRHVPELADLTDEEAQAIGLLMIRLSRALRESEIPPKAVASHVSDARSLTPPTAHPPCSVAHQLTSPTYSGTEEGIPCPSSISQGMSARG